MKRFLIHVSTSWCGMDDTFRAMAENDYELDEIANQLAYENFQFYDCENAVHYYGNIIIDGVSFSPEDSPNTYTMCTETYEAEEKNPLAAGFYRIELVRPVTSEEIEKDSSRWNGYKVGDKTNAFYSPEDVIAIAKEVCKARFLGNWKLKIVDYSGKDLDSEILISEL